ncbi:hypothetical protein ABIB86_000461 [Bradyrhizobium sp. JR1.7]|uniref:hypothetical protein n=1 Tax=unclassified Bradyrhizobium TaxID=2631580 RepID=UPI0033999E04
MLNISHHHHGAITVNEAIKSVSAVKRYPRAQKKRGGETVIWHRYKSLDEEARNAYKISRELVSSIGRLMVHNHLTPLQAEAARRVAYVMARFEKFHVEGRRTARSPSFERAFGSDQTLERLANETDGIKEYETKARKARKDYEKLMKAISPYGSQAKNVLDDLCCSDVEPPAQYRQNIALVLSAVAKAFDVTVNVRRTRKVRP